MHNLAPSDLLHRLDGQDEPTLTGTGALVEAAFDLSHRLDGKQQLVAMTTVEPWTLLIEPNGYLGVTEDLAPAASAGTRWVSHFVDINGLDAFLWAEDSVRRLWFEPMFPDERWGTTPDESLDVMHSIGFHFGDDSPEADLSSLAAFALAQHLTGVAVAPELLEGTAFTCGSVEVR
ncbi:DUF6461 domain-containing protein [Streptomyces sp. NPDC057697]|uniref:DUF6461 domain-containing protein n=1 Tax=Streptomyces sp. NPDC057697 TaxID=3346219 RepID=UPI003680C8F2